MPAKDQDQHLVDSTFGYNGSSASVTGEIAQFVDLVQHLHVQNSHDNDSPKSIISLDSLADHAN